MTARTAVAPYTQGDWVTVMRHDSGGTVVGPLQIDRVVALSDGRSWRLCLTRANGQPLEVTVDPAGVDVHGYVRPTDLCGWCGRPVLGEPVRDAEQLRWLRPAECGVWCSEDCRIDNGEAQASGGNDAQGARS